MRHLNYNHLLYFWTTAREGSIVRAAEVLHLTPQTISGQLRLLDEAVGDPLFNKAGRGLVLSATGEVVFQYAEEIFSVGAELAQWVSSEEKGAPNALRVGVVNSIAKLISHRIIAPVLAGDQQVRIVCHENDFETLLSQMSVHRLDIVISDQPLSPGMHVKAFNHLLGESKVSFFAGQNLRQPLHGEFPCCLNQAPVLLPTRETSLRRALDDWFEQRSLVPRLVAEFDDSALMKAFGEAGAGV
ncbi:MAG: transcriptional activator NhaR, partial [Pseudomonadales bacterium]|nr:transcriptional activator NhaR [Pseudomonadales bacterium]